MMYHCPSGTSCHDVPLGQWPPRVEGPTTVLLFLLREFGWPLVAVAVALLLQTLGGTIRLAATAVNLTVELTMELSATHSRSKDPDDKSISHSNFRPPAKVGPPTP